MSLTKRLVRYIWRVSMFVPTPNRSGRVLDSHDYLFERGVAGAFAESVDAAFDLSRARGYRRQAVGDRHAEVVVAVDAHHGLVYVRHVLADEADAVVELGGYGVADRVGDVDGVGAGVYDCFEHPVQVLDVRARGVHGRKFHVVAVLFSTFDRGDGHLQHLLRVAPELVHDLNVGA